VQILYLLDMRRQPLADAIAAFYDTLYSEESDQRPKQDVFMEDLVSGTVEKMPELDARIGKHSDNWRLERMPAVDRNIIRMSLFEMLHGGTPPAVAIDEALELARRFSGDESVAFINGVLDALRREIAAQDAGQPQKRDDAVN
jgi:N utilization substance protein B